MDTIQLKTRIKEKLFKQANIQSQPSKIRSKWPLAAMIGGAGAMGVGLSGILRESPEVSDLVTPVTESIPSAVSSISGNIPQAAELSTEDSSMLPYLAGGGALLGGGYGLKKLISNKLAASRAAAANSKLRGRLGLGAAALGGLGLMYSMSKGKNNERSKDQN